MKFSGSLRIFAFQVLAFFVFSAGGINAQDDSSRRDPSILSENRIPGYVTGDDVLENETNEDSKGPNSNPTATKPKSPSNPTATQKEATVPLNQAIGFSSDSSYVEIRGGGSLWAGGPAIRNINSGLRSSGFDSYYTYGHGGPLEKYALFSGIQSYPGVEMQGHRMGLLYDKAVSDHWSVGGGIDYREYRVNRVPDNRLSRSLIQGQARFPSSDRFPSHEDVQKYIGYELAGLRSFANSVVANKIVFLEVNASYHFIPENHWDPYLRPVFGIGYDTTSRNFAIKLGGGAGLRYYFTNGIYLGTELGADMIYLAQDQIVKSQSKTRIHEVSYSFFIGKKFY